MRNVILSWRKSFEKHSRETRRAFRILIVGKFLIYKKKTGTGECGRYRFGQVPHLCVSFKKKNEIFDRGREGDDDMGGEYEKKKKGEKESERERKREKERLREI